MKISLTPEEFIELCKLIYPLVPEKPYTPSFMGTGISWDLVKPKRSKPARRKSKAKTRKRSR